MGACPGVGACLGHYSKVQGTSRFTSNVEGNKVIHKILQVNTSTGIRTCHPDNLSQDIIRDLLLISNGFESLYNTVLANLTHGTYALSIAFGSEGMKEL